MTKAKRILTIILLLALVITIGGELFLALSVRTSAAEAVSHSNVLDDLSKDSKFNPADYPAKADDYSLQVIQIAEGTNGELFVYVYQPSAETKFLPATSIVFSTGITFDDRDYEEYKLSLLSMHGVFHKYKVNDFSIKNDDVRYYAISEIFRTFDSTIDEKPSDDNTITEKAFTVGHLWTVNSTSENVSYSVEYEDVVDVTEKHVGFIRYEGGVFWYKDDLDSHYVAFDTDRSIDELLEVDIIFHTEKVTIRPDSSLGNITTKTERAEKDHKLTLKKNEVLEGNTSGFFKESYKYNRIQSIDAFLENEGDDLKNSTKSDLEGMKWVLRFYESDYIDTLQANTSGDGLLTTYTGMYVTTSVTEVAMLRIMYEYDGIIYNLGVVDDKQSGDTNPDNKTGVEDEEWWQKIMAALGIIITGIIILVFWGPVKLVLDLLWTGLKFLFSIAISVIKLPFKILGWLLKL